MNHTENMKLPPLRHGHITNLASRSKLTFDGTSNAWLTNGLEAGKFFPKTEKGLLDPIDSNDNPNNLPPPDGKIASANQSGAEILDTPGGSWRKHSVKPGEEITIEWLFTARHATRRWNYFITRKDWNYKEVLSRTQFEEKPHHSVEYSETPYWNYREKLTPPASGTQHTFELPKDREGYHVLLGVWEVADTGNAFYQVIDLDFSN